ncbi:MAG TPA: O-antigen ligase family protein [Gaiellaceae bacterium]|nr:O-antigen ligase family protein [Gaiellaceae bacterium]
MTRRVIDALFLAALFSVSFIGLRWQIAGYEPKLSDFLMVGFLVGFTAEAARSRTRLAGPAAVVVGFGAALGLAYLAAVPAIDGRAELAQFSKGMAYFALHFAFLAAGVHWLRYRSQRFFHLALACLLGGIAANGLYAGLQLLATAAGYNLDALVLSPLTGRPPRSLSYGLMYGPDTPRARGLTRDPNHLGVMLLLPTLALLALSGRLAPLRRRRSAAAACAGLLIVMALTLSRSAALGLAAGVLFLLLADRSRFPSRTLVASAGAAALVLGLVAATNAHKAERVVGARLGFFGFAGLQHFRTYELLRPALSAHPFFGVGLNNFTLTYAQRVNGIREASHSFYVQSLIETGVVGAAVFALFLAYVVHRLYALRASDDPNDADLRPALFTVLGAPLAATLVANGFYMTMSFSYFFAFLVFILAAVGVRAARSPGTAHPSVGRSGPLAERAVRVRDDVREQPPHVRVVDVRGIPEVVRRPAPAMDVLGVDGHEVVPPVQAAKIGESGPVLREPVLPELRQHLRLDRVEDDHRPRAVAVHERERLLEPHEPSRVRVEVQRAVMLADARDQLGDLGVQVLRVLREAARDLRRVGAVRLVAAVRPAAGAAERLPAEGAG